MPKEEKQDPEYEQEQALIELKRKIRSQMRVRRRDSDPEWILAASKRIQSAVMRCPQYQAANSVGAYLALPYEVQTRLLLDDCWKSEKRICVPAFHESESRYELMWLQEDDPMMLGRWNVAEPENQKRAGLMDVDCISVPAMAYDENGGRLGHGGGHYDRMLGAWSGYKIGVAFDFQILDEVPLGSQDIPVDLVVTETRIFTPDGPVDF